MSRPKKRSPLTVVFGAALVAGLGWIGISGFSGEQDPNAVWGTVLLDGEPIEVGQLMFVPNEAKGNQGGKAFADIRNGKYATIPSQPVSPGHSLALISVYPLSKAGDHFTFEKLSQIETYQVDVEIPDGGASDFLVNISSR